MVLTLWGPITFSTICWGLILVVMSFPAQAKGLQGFLSGAIIEGNSIETFIMAKRDYYKVLGVPAGATTAQIKKAYRRLARKYHPDTAGDDPQAQERFKELQEAYEVINDPKKRQMYDRFGHADMKMGQGQGPWPGGASTAGPFGGNWSQGGGRIDFDLSDLFGRGGMGDVFDQLRGRTGRRTPRSVRQRGADIEHTIKLGFTEAISGSTRDVSATVQQADGQQRHERISIKIPPGVDNGSKIRVRGKGQPGIGGHDGDLIIKIEVEEHPYFQRDGNDIYLEVPVTFAEAALGAKIEVPTLSDRTTVKIPPHSSSGRKLRLRGKGVKSHKSGKAGDMFLTLKVAPPKKLDEESKQLLQEFARKNPQDDIRKDWS